MGELTIYDSQGMPFDGGVGAEDERIKEFFFDGVRFVLNMRLANEAVVFFRARDNETARSEQYYAVYKFEHKSELRQLGDEIRRVIEDEHGMLLDTSQDDTEVFQYLVGDRSDERSSIGSPGDRNTEDDIEKLLQKGQNVSVGVDSYRNACGVFNAFARKSSVSQVAIADSASSSRLDGYDFVIEVGSYRGLEPIGSTAGRLETLRERRRQRLQPSTTDSSPQGGPIGRVLNADTWAVDFAFGALVLFALFGGVVYGGCALNLGPQGLFGTVPLLGDECASSGSPVTIENASYDAQANAFIINGSTGENQSSFDPQFNVSLQQNSTGVTKTYGNQNVTIGNGTYNATLSVEPPLDPQRGQRYWINVTAANRTDSIGVTIEAVPNGTSMPNGTVTPSANETGTATPVATTQATATATDAGTTTRTPTATDAGTTTGTPSGTDVTTATSTPSGSNTETTASTASSTESAKMAGADSTFLSVASLLGLLGVASVAVTATRGD